LAANAAVPYPFQQMSNTNYKSNFWEIGFTSFLFLKAKGSNFLRLLYRGNKLYTLENSHCLNRPDFFYSRSTDWQGYAKRMWPDPSH